MAVDPRAASTELLQFNDDTMTLLVGREQQKLLVHRSHLERAPTFFQAAVKPVWTDGKCNPITLTEDDPVIVKTYLHFLYTGRIACMAPASDIKTSSVAHCAETLLLAKLYVFGEKYQDEAFKNAVIDAIIAKSQVLDVPDDGWFLTEADVDIIYEGTCAGSPARKLMVDMHVRYGESYWLEEGVTNNEFLMDLSRKLLDMRDPLKGQMPLRSAEDESCLYHSHEDGENCAATKPTVGTEEVIELDSEGEDI